MMRRKDQLGLGQVGMGNCHQKLRLANFKGKRAIRVTSTDPALMLPAAAVGGGIISAFDFLTPELVGAGFVSCCCPL